MHIVRVYLNVRNENSKFEMTPVFVVVYSANDCVGTVLDVFKDVDAAVQRARKSASSYTDEEPWKETTTSKEWRRCNGEYVRVIEKQLIE